jgi:trypsin
MFANAATLLALFALPFAYALPIGGPGEVVNGTEVNPPFSYPWLGEIKAKFFSSNDGSHYCGGSLIAPNVLLTAAHCSTRSPSGYIVSLHRHNIRKTSKEEGGADFLVEKIIKHPEYVSASSTGFDFAIWKLTPVKNLEEAAFDSMDSMDLDSDSDSDSIEFGSIDSFDEEDKAARRVDFESPESQAQLAITLDDGTYSATGTETLSAGWGAVTQGGRGSDVLLQVTVPIVDQARCQELYSSYTLTDSMICAGYEEGGRDTCQGDSGGPLFVVPAGKSPVLVGVVSWGRGCAQQGYFGIYARVSAVKSWIEETVAKL